MTKTANPRIYVACLAAYNNGVLHGAWIDADQDADNIRAEIQKILDSSPVPGAEEYAIHDFEGFGSFSVGEYMPIDEVAELAALMAEYGEAYSAYAENVGKDYATAEGFEESYVGEYDDVKDYAWQMAEKLYFPELPDHVRDFFVGHFDIDSFVRDLTVGGDIWTTKTPDHNVWVFRNV